MGLPRHLEVSWFLGWTWPPFAHLSHSPSCVCGTALGSKGLAQGTVQLLAPILLDVVQGPNCLCALEVPIISSPPKQEHYLLGSSQIQSYWLHLGFPNYLSSFFCWNSSVWNPLGQELGFLFLFFPFRYYFCGIFFWFCFVLKCNFGFQKIYLLSGAMCLLVGMWGQEVSCAINACRKVLSSLRIQSLGTLGIFELARTWKCLV